VLHIFFLIIAGLILTGVLAAILEALALQNHPYAAKFLAGIHHRGMDSHLDTADGNNCRCDALRRGQTRLKPA
jgi:hypothetical protein